ncbi:MAG: hypothetical protein ACPW60_07085 [Methylohalobius sp. ZOD2]
MNEWQKTEHGEPTLHWLRTGKRSRADYHQLPCIDHPQYYVHRQDSDRRMIISEPYELYGEAVRALLALPEIDIRLIGKGEHHVSTFQIEITDKGANK